jgi:hypothetical protein
LSINQTLYNLIMPHNYSGAKCLPLILAALFATSCKSAFLRATLSNRNVYKTKGNLVVKKIYVDGRLATDKREFTIKPNAIPTVTKTVTTVTVAPAANKPSSQTTRVEVVSTIPEVSTTVPSVGTVPALTSVTNSITTTTIETNTPPGPAVPSTTATATTTLSVPAARAIAGNHFIRYKVVSDEGDFKYIKILPGVHFGGPAVAGAETDIVYGPPPAGMDDPSDYVYMVSKKDLLPHTHYLATSALIGKVITIPLRIRNEYWNGDNKTLQGTLALSYGFGWKFKLGNNPYRPHYFTTILYAAGISQQKHFFLAGKYKKEPGQDSVSTKTDEIAVTYMSFGAAYEFDKFNVGVFAGKDRMFGNLKNWVYQDKWWVGLGIGYDLFK